MNKIKLLMFLTIGTFFTACTNAQTPEQKANAVIENVNATEFAKLIEEGNGSLIDVRTPGENAAGNIEGSTLININGGTFNEDIQKLNKDVPVYVYCRSGARSMSAARKMEAEGFTKIYNLDGGYISWSKQF